MVYANGSRFSVFSFLDTARWAAAGSNDYVPLEINALEIGRGITQGVTGPSLGGVQDDSVTGYALVNYTIGNLTSPTTQVNLPVYAPAAPVVVSDSPTGLIQLQLNGAFQVTDATSGSSPTSYTVWHSGQSPINPGCARCCTLADQVVVSFRGLPVCVARRRVVISLIDGLNAVALIKSFGKLGGIAWPTCTAATFAATVSSANMPR